jgi:hypothetical protein
MGETIVSTLRDTWAGYAAVLALALPRLLAMASVLVVGFLVAAGARFVLVRLLLAVRFGAFAERAGLAELLRKAELPAAERLAGTTLFWLLFSGFLLAGLDAALGIETLGGLRDELVTLLPRLVASLLIFGMGLVLATVVGRVALLAAVNAGWPFARAAGGLVHALLVLLAVAMALDHLGVARGVVVTAFALAFGAVLLALAIAVGIGAGPIVGRLLEERLAVRRRPEGDSSSHL